MDIQVFGITFADFLRAFKKVYKLSDGTYDYMAFLKDADCASYCGMMATYKNPNEILNEIMTPSLNNIQIINGGKKKMKGGGGYQLMLVGLLYVLSISNIFAGPLHDSFIAKYGNDPKAWPKKPENAPTEPGNRWNGFFITIGPSAKSIEAYNKAKAQFDNDIQKYETFIIEHGRAIEEVEKETETKLTQAKTGLTEAETDQLKAKTIKDMSDFTKSQILTNAELERSLGRAEGKAEEKARAEFWKGIAIGAGSVIGLLFYYVNRMFNRFERLENGTYTARRVGVEIFDVDQGQRGQRRQITDQGQLQITDQGPLQIENPPNQLRQRYPGRYGGKKTRKHRKRTNRRH